MGRRTHAEPVRIGCLHFPPTWNVIDTNKYCGSRRPKPFTKRWIISLGDRLDAEPCEAQFR
jgi:hypothetical protein